MLYTDFRSSLKKNSRLTFMFNTATDITSDAVKAERVCNKRLDAMPYATKGDSVCFRLFVKQHTALK